MATGNLFQGLGKGSIGDVVFYRNNGKQVSRVRNRQVKNPKTSAQMAQRTIMQNVSQAYSAMKEIVDHSRQGISYGAKTMAAFMKDNLNVARAIAANPDETSASWVNRGIQVPPVLPLVMSRGTLEPQTGKYVYGKSYLDGTHKVDALNTSASFHEADMQGAAIKVSVSTFMQTMGLSRGDILTFCFVVADSPYNFGQDNATLKTRFIYGRLNFNGSYPEGWEDESLLESNVLDWDDSNLIVKGKSDVKDPSLLVIGAYHLSSDTVKLEVYPNVLNVENPPIILAACVIKSTKDGASYQRSTETMVINSDLPDGLSFNSFEDALLSYQQKGESLGGSPYYLNGGNE